MTHRFAAMSHRRLEIWLHQHSGSTDVRRRSRDNDYCRSDGLAKLPPLSGEARWRCLWRADSSLFPAQI